MTDAVLQQNYAQATKSINFVTGSGATLLVPVQAPLSKQNTSLVTRPAHQAKGGYEQQHFWLRTPQNGSVSLAQTTAAFQSTGIQDAASMAFQWLLRKADQIVDKMWIEVTGTLPSATYSTSISIYPPQLAIDRIEFNYNGNYPLQRVYQDRSFRWMVRNLLPHELYHVANMSGGWINPPNTPGIAPTAFTSASASNFTRGARDTNQLMSSVWVIYPFHVANDQTSTLGGNTNLATDNHGCMFRWKIPAFYGSFLDQLRFFDFNWLGNDILYITGYAMRPIYNTAVSTTVNDIIVTDIQLLQRVCSFPNGAEKAKIHDAVSGNGLFVMFLDTVRSISAAAPNTVTAIPTSTGVTNQTSGVAAFGLGPTTAQPASYNSILLDPGANRKLTEILIINRAKTLFGTTGTGWVFCNDFIGMKTGFNNTVATVGASFVPGGANPCPQFLNIHNPNASSVTAGVAVQHTAWGFQTTSGYPYCDILDSSQQRLFSSPGHMSIEDWQLLNSQSKSRGYMYSYGYVPGQSCFNEFRHSDIPMEFADIEESVKGVYSGSLEVGMSYRFDIGLGPYADWADTYDIYFTGWKCMCLNQSPGKLHAYVLPDPAVPQASMALKKARYGTS